VSRLPHLPLVPLSICGALLALIYIIYTTAVYVKHEYDLQQEETRLQREIAQLERDRAYLVSVRDYLRSDEYIEDAARRILGLVRPGETLVVVSSSAPEISGDATPAPERTPGAPWWKDLFVQPQVAPAPTPVAPAVIDAPASSGDASSDDASPGDAPTAP
jgi:cell division protein FtsB